MTREEFSNSFDTLLDSYAHQVAYGQDSSKADLRFDEYEKSVFLTNAQDDIVLNLYSGRNSLGTGFEETEELRRYLSNLVLEAELDPITTSDGKPLGMESNSKFFTLPSNLWFITYESVKLGEGAPCGNGSMIDVMPVRQDEYHKIKRNPFRGANDRRALRLDLSEGNIEIISRYTVTKYYLRYLKQLKPIILVDLDPGLSIKDISEATDCELHEALHLKILERAVVMALQRGARRLDNNN